MQSDPTPSTCPVCGEERFRRHLWGGDSLSSRKREDIEAGRAVLGRRRRDKGRHGPGVYGHPHQGFDVPEQVFLRCQPGWLEVHRMALEEDELQLAKEKAILAHNFEVAAALLHRQDKIDDRLTELVRRLIGE
jgi:hypothetical protein